MGLRGGLHIPHMGFSFQLWGRRILRASHSTIEITRQPGWPSFRPLLITEKETRRLKLWGGVGEGGVGEGKWVCVCVSLFQSGVCGVCVCECVVIDLHSEVCVPNSELNSTRAF